MASRGSRQNGGRRESGHTRNREREREGEPESLKNASRQPLRRLAGSAADEVKVGGERRDDDDDDDDHLDSGVCF